MQEKTFTKWSSVHLTRAGHEKLEDLSKDFKTGIVLKNLLEAISAKVVPGKFTVPPKIRIQMIQNITHCFTYIADAG